MFFEKVKSGILVRPDDPTSRLNSSRNDYGEIDDALQLGRLIEMMNLPFSEAANDHTPDVGPTDYEQRRQGRTAIAGHWFDGLSGPAVLIRAKTPDAAKKDAAKAAKKASTGTRRGRPPGSKNKTTTLPSAGNAGE